MKIAVEGCCHGRLEEIYQEIARLESKNNYKVDLLLICGDFQAIRNPRDLQCMAVPEKYRELGAFYKYYTKQAIAPVLTIVIGGNHEASNYMWELYHGGWLCPNIYFLGHSGCVQVNGLKIAGISGIYGKRDFQIGYGERMPFNPSDMRSIYHTREYDVRKLSLLSTPHIFLSHDWPQFIERHGDTERLFKIKPHFVKDSETGELGSPPLAELLYTLKPRYWFAAHMHVKFTASIAHEVMVEDVIASGDSPDEIQITAKVEGANPDEIVLDDEIDDVEPAPPPPPVAKQRVTEFLALDKILPKRQFLEVVDVPVDPTSSSSPPRLTYDPEWLAITRAFHPFLSTTRRQYPMPDKTRAPQLVAKELEWVKQHIGTNGLLEITECQEFRPTAPGPGPGSEGNARFQQPPWYTNPQTVAFTELLGLENKINPAPPGYPNSASVKPGQ